jgi:hypothetical protein
VEHGELPLGAVEKDWRLTIDSTARRHATQAKAGAAGGGRGERETQAIRTGGQGGHAVPPH